MFEASNRSYCHEPSPRTADRAAGRSLGEQSRRLRDLHVAWMVDAGDFFYQFWPGVAVEERTEWPNLRYLSLTTKLLRTRHCDPLLQAAAAAAERMPKLLTMELWGIGVSVGLGFAYSVQDRNHTIFVSKEMAACTLESATIRAWQRVVDIRGSPCNLEFDVKQLRLKYQGSAGDV
ncbi:hypothetical protein ACRALDRAFT_1060573 [Sodiomyces alcalophilus JCM 7366]|uniref:uncharacterized protein n=1 Tax=Sodiomyces alcalophilus JCM 7366 TaxID=591952 RepID=UPI0039B535F9